MIARPRRLPGGTRLAALAGVVALLAGGCIPQAATTQAKAVSTLYWTFIGAGLVVAGIVWGLITWSIIRYRHRPQPGEGLPVQTRSDIRLEIVWTTLPILTVLALFWLTLGTLNRVEARAPDELQVHVTAFQWQWRFDYTGTGVSVIGLLGQPPVLVVPAGQPVHVTLTSSDVDHAFYVPAFLFKRDAIPGHPTDFDFTVTQPGIYRGQCAEFCGVYHDQMLFSVQAVPAAQFATWLAQQEAAASAGPTGASVTAPSASAPPSSAPSGAGPSASVAPAASPAPSSVP